ncbi:MAG: rane protein yeaL [Firmicutes bacterium]|nr:rane protein yeaL [Bacillota bacterium]
MSLDNLPLLIILVISVLGNNQSVAVAAGFLLLIKLLGLDIFFPTLESKGLNIGITILTIAILTPLASGRLSLKETLAGFCSPVGIIALVAGIFVAWVAGRGLTFINTSPEMVGFLVLGTTFGVCFLHGVAIGPLIAGGLVSLSIFILNAFK